MSPSPGAVSRPGTGTYYDFAAKRIAGGLSATRTISSSAATPFGTRGATTPWATARSSLSSIASSARPTSSRRPRRSADRRRARRRHLAPRARGPHRYAHAPGSRASSLALHPGMILLRGARDDRSPSPRSSRSSRLWLAVRDRRPARGDGPRRAHPRRRGRSFWPQALLCVPFLALLVTPKPSVRALGALCPRLRARAPPHPPADGAQLPRDGRLRSRSARTGGWNPRETACLPAGDRPLWRRCAPPDGCREVTGQVQQDRALAWPTGSTRSATHPLHWLALAPAKLGFTFDHESFAVEYLHEARPRRRPEARRSPGRDITTSCPPLARLQPPRSDVSRSFVAGGGAAVQGAPPRGGFSCSSSGRSPPKLLRSGRSPSRPRSSRGLRSQALPRGLGRCGSRSRSSPQRFSPT